MTPSISVFKSVLVNDLGKFPKEAVLNIDTNVVSYEDHNATPKDVGSVISFHAGVADFDEFQRRIHGVDLNLGSDSDLIVTKAVVLKKDTSVIPDLYELQSTMMNEVPKNFGDPSTYDFYVWDSRIMTAVGNKSNDSSSRNK